LFDGGLTGHAISFAYDDTTGRMTTTTASDGRVVTYRHDQINDGGSLLTSGNLVQVDGLEGIVSQFEYTDPNDTHNVTSIQEAPNTTPVINVYNADDQVTYQTNGHHRTNFVYTIPFYETRVEEITRDQNGENPTTAVTIYRFNDDGYTAEIEDAEGGLTKNIHNANNQVTRKEIWGPVDAQTGRRTLVKASNYVFNAQGQQVSKSVVMPNGDIVSKF
jgi:hypothetical protein